MLRDVRAYLSDILSAGEAILSFTAGLSFEDYANAPMVTAAVQHKFAIIGEALKQALRVDPGLANRIHASRDIVDFRNRVIHGYFNIEDRIVWSSIKAGLPELMSEVSRALKEMPE